MFLKVHAPVPNELFTLGAELRAQMFHEKLFSFLHLALKTILFRNIIILRTHEEFPYQDQLFAGLMTTASDLYLIMTVAMQK